MEQSETVEAKEQFESIGINDDIHHLVTPMLMQAAIRTDGGQRDTLIAENLFYKCMAQGIILKLNNRAENNILADVLAPPRGYYLSLREGPLADAVIKRNVFYSTGKDTVFIDPEHGDFRFETDSPALKLGIVPFDMSKVGLIDTDHAVQQLLGREKE